MTANCSSFEWYISLGHEEGVIFISCCVSTFGEFGSETAQFTLRFTNFKNIYNYLSVFTVSFRCSVELTYLK